MAYKAAKLMSVCLLCGTVILFTPNQAEAACYGTSSTGTAIAGVSVALNDYYTSLNRGTVSRSVVEDLITKVGLTQEEAGHPSVLDTYTNLGVANLTSGYLNVRKEPSESGEIIGKLTRHGGCEILGEENGWYKIQSGPVRGYVSADYIVVGDQAAQIASQEAVLMVRVDADALRVRTEPSTDARIWDQGYQGETYEVVEETGDGWVKIHLEGDEENSSGSDGYVYTVGNATLMYTLPEATKYSIASDVSSLRMRTVEYAMQFLGNRYVWGGTNPNTGADCSGFVQYVLRNAAGVSMNRTSREQAKQGTAIKSSQMRPGDLIFYGGSSGSVNHVAMYIGNGQVIHASTAKTGIKISQWNYRTPVAIRNVIGN